MKIEKLYTLSQFVDYVMASNSIEHWRKLGIIKDYNDFLKQSIKNEMFVNELEKPDRADYDIRFDRHDQFVKDIEAWEEAEKKVIFKGKVYIHEPKSDDLARISIHDNSKVFDLNIIFGKTTFHDLAEPIEGERELELQNVEL